MQLRFKKKKNDISQENWSTKFGGSDRYKVYGVFKMDLVSKGISVRNVRDAFVPFQSGVNENLPHTN